jgi:hypothetical protein
VEEAVAEAVPARGRMRTRPRAALAARAQSLTAGFMKRSSIAMSVGTGDRAVSTRIRGHDEYARQM